MKPTTTVFLFLLALFPSLAIGSSAQAQSNDQQTIIQLEDQFAEAWTKRDLKFVERYFSHDPDLVWFFERRQLKGFEDVRKLYERMFSAASNVKRTLANRVIRVYGDAAFSSANFRIEGVEAGRRVVDEGRISTFYAKQDGQWVAVHRHTSFQAPLGQQRRVPLLTGADPRPAPAPKSRTKPKK
jgi:ketosteroid isomerase-like protein